ncbi:MAG: PBP1A family penicillin-binding protein, partial [Beijerinckiaceae bacterium]|nr:PBP1A family penicillin-binding protein [Beijerinckiaceae bacterium]
MASRTNRQEPSFGEKPKKKKALSVDPGDRIGGGRKAGRTRKPGIFARMFGRTDPGRKNKKGNPAGEFDEQSTPKKSRGSKSTARRPRRRSILGGLVYWSFVAAIWGLIGTTAIVTYYAGKLPPIDKLAVPKRPPNIAILAADGSLLANRGDTGGPAIPLRELPAYLPKAFVSIEDRRFYSHWGIDLQGIGRAVWINLVRKKRGMQGGSTLTQQLAKNLFLTQERTASRKIQEAILAVWLEQNYSKDQILQLYLNRVYFGAGAYGVEAAAQRYFGVSARNVSLAQAAVLAGLMKAPVRYAPNRNPEAAEARAALVLTAMAQEGHITEAMAKIALSAPARAKASQGSDSINYVADFVMDRLDQILGAFDHDLVVETTISPAAQKYAQMALVQNLDKYGNKYRVTQGAVVAMDPGGGILAMVGGKDYAKSQFNRAVAARRQPGSAFKPFVYLTALERGLSPDTRRLDAPLNIRGWRPENSNRKYYGDVTLTRALSLSLNTVAVRLALELGPKQIANTARRLGVRSALKTNASLALGTSEVNLLEMTGAYAVFANGGIAVDPFVITRVRRSGGNQGAKVVYRHRFNAGGRIIAPKQVAMINSMMQETLLTGTARRAELPGWQAAGKTGTTQDYKDAWFIGYTSKIVTGVWLGNDNSAPTRKASGGNVPVFIWSQFMRNALAKDQPDRLPTGIWRDPATDNRAPPASSAV